MLYVPNVFLRSLISILVFNLITIFYLPSIEASEIRFGLFLSNKKNKRLNQEIFDCTSPIVLNFYWSKLVDRDHLLEAFWYRPDGKKQETTVNRFNFTKGRAAHTWMKLILKRGNSRNFFFPGNGWEEFIGPWKVNIYLNGDFLAKKVFNVNC